MGVVVLGDIGVGMDCMEVFSDSVRLVSKMVEDYVEEVVHRHMVVEIGNHSKVYHIRWIGMHYGAGCNYNMPEEVVAMKMVHMLEAPLTFDSPTLNANLIEIFVSYNIVGTKLIAKRVRIHSERRK
ncbi:hypothetical protein AHAS_Ahas16G0203600 [Arachis hypogaea]